jgi:hypothetical protein
MVRNQTMRILILLFLFLSLNAAETLFYEYDQDGYLVGTYKAEQARPNSTTLDFRPIKPPEARFVVDRWISDPSKQQQRDTEETQKKTKEQQAKAFLKNYDPDKASNAEVREAVKAILTLLKDIAKE